MRGRNGQRSARLKSRPANRYSRGRNCLSSMYTQEAGPLNAPTIVFLHGGGMSGWIWKVQLDHFRDFHCLVPDLPGHGHSASEPLASLKDCAGKTAELIYARAHRPVHIVGHSLGAKVLLEFLSGHPDLADHAVVASALCRPIRLMQLMHHRWIYQMSASLSRRRSLIRWTAKSMGFSDEFYRTSFVHDTQQLTAEALEKIYGLVLENLNLPPGLSNVKTRVLAVAGSNEPKAMRQSVRDTAALIPTAKGVFLKRAGHTFPWVQGGEFNSLIRAWITDSPLNREALEDA